MTRDDILAFVIVIEGGYVNNPADPGGATKYGVTQRYYDDRKARGTVPAGYPDSVADLTTAQASQLYATDQWVQVRGDDLPPLLQLMAVDCAVNQGGPTACLLLQDAAGVTKDGHIGPATLAAIHAVDPVRLLLRFGVARAMRYIKGNPLFLLGWIRRLFRVYTATLLDKPVSDF